MIFLPLIYVYVYSNEKCKRFIFPKIKNSDLLKLPVGVTLSDLREWLKIEFLEGTTTFPQLIGTIYKMNENHNFQIGEHVFLRSIVEPIEVQILKFYKGLRGRPQAEVQLDNGSVWCVPISHLLRVKRREVRW